MMNPVVHFEMPYRDAERAERFYTSAFGWQTQLLGPEMGHYLLVTTALTDAKPGSPAGSINGGLFPFKPDWPAQYPSVVIGAEDIRAAMQRVTTAGGEVLGDPMEIPGIGKYVSFIDTEGNRNSMMQPAMA
jgi:predicted enzyme related to lactoylglutathione lyase